MTNKEQYFTHEQVENIDANKLVHGRSKLGDNVDELVKEGKITKLDLTGYSSLSDEADQRHKKFLSDKKKIETSDNPLYEDKRIRDYEVKELKKAYEADIAEIDERYQEYRKKAMQSAKEQKAREQGVKVSESDKGVAKSLLNKYSIELMTKGKDKEGEVISVLIDDIQQLENAEREAMVAELPSFLQYVDSTTERQKLAKQVRGNTQADNAVEIARQLPTTCVNRFNTVQNQAERKY